MNIHLHAAECGIMVYHILKKGVLKMLYVDGLLNDKEFTAKEKREVIIEAFEAKDLSIDYLVSVNITNPDQIHIILESMELASKKNPRLATKKWLSYVQGCMESDSDKIKRKAARVMNHILPTLTSAPKKGAKVQHP